MAAQYDSESKGERNLAFKPVSCSDILLGCIADLLNIACKKQSAKIQRHLVLALELRLSLFHSTL